MSAEVDYEKVNADLYEGIVEAHKNGEISYMVDGERIMKARFEDFIDQPADGILFDLNRLPEVTMTLFKKSKSSRWINDIAMAYVIKGLKDKIDGLEKKIDELKSNKQKPKETPNKRTIGRIGANQIIESNIGV